jgi:hypothetical protein
MRTSVKAVVAMVGAVALGLGVPVVAAAVPGELDLTVKGPGDVTVTLPSGDLIVCGPPADGSRTEMSCEITGAVNADLVLAAAGQHDQNTDGRFLGWSGRACSGLEDCTVTLTTRSQLVTASFTDDHPTAVTVGSPAENQLVITPTGAMPLTLDAQEALGEATCQLDAGTTWNCLADGSVTVASGDPTQHTLTVHAKDRWAAAGMGTEGVATRHWRAYITQDTTIGDGPSDGGAIDSPTAAFAFSATKRPASATTTFTCTLDAVTDAACVSGRAWEHLPEGPHTFTVASIVDFGPGLKAIDASPAVRRFTVDLTPPDTTIAGGPAEGLLTNVRGAVFDFTANESGVSFECSLDGGGFGPCPGGVSGRATYADVGLGRRSLAVRAVDRAGNRDPLPATRSWTVTADLDRDGFTLPGDCNDSDAAIHPGAPEVLDNGVDEDCNGVPELNLDRDGDRFARPQDCNDADAAIHPGAGEIAGNKVDENCDGTVEPFPTLPSSVGYSWVPRGRATVLKAFFVRNAQAGSTIRMRCRARRGRCAIPPRRQRVKASAHVVDLTRLVRGRRLLPGTALEVTITKPQTIGSFTSLRFRPRGGPLRRERCLPPGARSPRAC